MAFIHCRYAHYVWYTYVLHDGSAKPGTPDRVVRRIPCRDSANRRIDFVVCGAVGVSVNCCPIITYARAVHAFAVLSSLYFGPEVVMAMIYIALDDTWIVIDRNSTSEGVREKR